MNLDEARQVLSEHAKSKRNGQFEPRAELTAKLLNPICGDQVEMRARIENGIFRDVGFAARACAICSASASLLSEAASGWTVGDARDLKGLFEKAVTQSADESWPEELNAFRSFEHLRLNPRRRGCAILPWLALVRLDSKLE